MYIKGRYLALISLVLAGALPHAALASYNFDWKHGQFALQLGAAFTNAGESKQVGINGLIGDYFSVHSNDDTTAIVGLGYYVKGPACPLADTRIGINAFYIPDANVSGIVTQERIFNNLSYNYDITSYPILLDVKTEFHTRSTMFTPTLDVGIGPNIMSLSKVNERSLDGGVTLPDNILNGNTTTTFAASVGVGVKFNQLKLPYHASAECGYRFFYLGSSSFDKANGQVQNSMSTGNVYANTVLCTLAV